MPIQHIHAFLVHPAKGAEDVPAINGVSVPLKGKMFDLLEGIYSKSENECDIDITFRPTVDGKQQNECRNLICVYLGDPTLQNGRLIAQRLQATTDGRSGLGLLFLIGGRESKDHKIVISRFPTDNAIYVDENPRTLKVEFLERVFMKNKYSYKAVAYRDSSVKAGFWSGRAIDKQLNSGGGDLSDYWISDFLMSDFTVTAAQGTRRLAISLRGALKKAPLDVKRELSAAATLAHGLAGQRITIDEFANRFGLSQPARTSILGELKTVHLAGERFEFDLNEYKRLVAFKSVQLNNDATLTAPSDKFAEVFTQEIVDDKRQRVRFTTEGSIVDEKLKTGA